LFLNPDHRQRSSQGPNPLMINTACFGTKCMMNTEPITIPLKQFYWLFSKKGL